MTDADAYAYAYWRAALAGQNPPIHDAPQAGFYRRRRQEGGFDRVAIWRGDDGEMVATVGDRAADAEEIWLFVADKAITEAAYRAHERGDGWADTPATVAVVPAESGYHAAEIAATSLMADAKLVSAEMTEADAKRLAALAVALKRAETAAKGNREVEQAAIVAPYIDALRASDKGWAAAITLIQRGRSNIIRRIAAWAEPRGIKSVGNVGSKISSRTIKSAVVLDFDAAAAALKQTPDMQALVQRLANAAARSGRELPGCEIKIERKW